ncbi:MAG TPA: site-specific integrase [Thermoanaerobacter sp.]|nr:site-specific integrase [Thermoanaerobacter sp.]
MAKKRGNGEGTIYQRSDSLWVGQITIGYDPATGKPKRKSFYGKTRKEVADKITQALQDVRKGTYIEPTQITLGEWLDKWLTEYKKGQLKPSTYDSYETLINVHIKPALGKIKLVKLQPHMLQSFYNQKLENGRTDGKGGLSTRMVRYLHVIIRQALQQAVKEGLLTRNVADATNPPTIKNKQIRPLTEEELLRFFEVAKDDRLFAAYVVAATTGLRRGELLGLCWDSVDLEQGIITVKRQLLVLKEGLKLEETTKSKSGKRNITLTDDAIRELKAHRKRQLQEKLLFGEAYQDNGLVFCKEDGSPLDPREFTKRFQRLLEKAGLPKVRLHDLRHTHASLLLARGVHPKVVQERLGHSSITITLDLYSHLVPGLQELAAQSLNGLLSKTKNLGKTQG